MPEKSSSLSTSTQPVPTSLRMRKINLNLPQDYYKRLTTSTHNPLRINSPKSATQSKPISENVLKSLLEKVLSIKTKIEIKRENGMVKIGLSGVTSEMKIPNPPHSNERTTLGVTVGYDGSFKAYKNHIYILSPGLHLQEKISTASGQPFQLEYKLQKLAIAMTFKSNEKQGMSFDRWEFSVSWGNIGPNIQNLSEIMKKGEESVRGVFGALKLLDSLDDVKTVTEAIKPHIEPIKKSVDSAASIMKIERGFNVSFKVEGPCQRVRTPLGISLDDHREAGVKGMIYLTVRF